MPPETEQPDISLYLHDKLLTGDPTASALIAELYLPRLITDLKPQYPSVDDHLLSTAAEDALLSYLLHPGKFDPSRLPLFSYLRMSARGDLLNALKKQKITSNSYRFGEVVELDTLDVEQDIEDISSSSLEEIILYKNSTVWDRLTELLTDPVDQEIVLLMMENVRDTEAYASILGILGLSPDEQMREVKRQKDRIKKRLQRHIQRSEIEQYD